MSRKVALLLSGGIDSTVAGYLLKQKGFSVHAFFLRIKPAGQNFDLWREAEGKARLSAADLNIAFSVIDLRNEFKDGVVDFFIKEIKAGRTPNPCSVCNPKIKFGAFWEKVKPLGFDFMATGHYAGIEKINNDFFLKKGADSKKDQSYFLYRIERDLLPFIQFPLAALTKGKVKDIAIKKINKRFANMGESQGVCFLGGMKYADFVKKNIPTNEGAVVDEKGETVGSHPGVWFFTEGQKTGIRNIKYHNQPAYVTKKDYRNNILFVASNPKEDSSMKKEIEIRDWLFHGLETTPKNQVWAKIRYGAEEASGSLEIKSKKKAIFRAKKPVGPIASGQSIVFYNKNIVLGGGIIE